MKQPTSKTIITILSMMLIGSWISLYFEVQKASRLESDLIESTELTDTLLGVGSNVDTLTEEQYRICQKVIPQLMKDNPKLLEQFNMDISFRESDTKWIIEMFSRGLIGGGQEIHIDKKTEEVIASWGTL